MRSKHWFGSARLGWYERWIFRGRVHIEAHPWNIPLPRITYGNVEGDSTCVAGDTARFAYLSFSFGNRWSDPIVSVTWNLPERIACHLPERG